MTDQFLRGEKSNDFYKTLQETLISFCATYGASFDKRIKRTSRTRLNFSKKIKELLDYAAEKVLLCKSVTLNIIEDAEKISTDGPFILQRSNSVKSIKSKNYNEGPLNNFEAVLYIGIEGKVPAVNETETDSNIEVNPDIKGVSMNDFDETNQDFYILYF